MQLTKYDISIVVAYIVTVAITYGSQSGAFGADNKEISDKNPTPLTPAGWTFAIWGLIFMSQAAAIIYLLVRRDAALADHKRHVTATLAAPLAVGWICEAAWQFAFVQNTTLSMVASALILIGAATAFHVAARAAPGATAQLPAAARTLVCACISVNAAWVLVATTVGVLIAVGRVAPAASSAVAASVAAALVALFGVAWAATHRDAAYAFTLVWAFWGVRAGGGAMYRNVAAVATVAMVAFVALGGGLALLRYLSRPGAAGGRGGDDNSAEQPLVHDEQ